jgi:hypothetical protein
MAGYVIYLAIVGLVESEAGSRVGSAGKQNGRASYAPGASGIARAKSRSSSIVSQATPFQHSGEQIRFGATKRPVRSNAVHTNGRWTDAPGDTEFMRAGKRHCIPQATLAAAWIKTDNRGQSRLTVCAALLGAP